MSANCPRCQKPLEEAQLDNLTARICRDCKGMLLVHADLMDVIDASWRAVTEKTAEQTQFHVNDAARGDPILRCPDCGQPMEKYGYMGMLAVQIDRCDACALVWLDADELQNMVLALAKSQYRSERALEFERAGILDLGASVPMPAPRRGVWLFSESPEDQVPLVAAQILLRLLLR